MITVGALRVFNTTDSRRHVSVADYIQPVANGIRTDHPYPNLPFVDDAHLPLDDPAGIEAIGRVSAGSTWGREDDDARTGEWIAFTTDPHNHSYGWLVQYHPKHGRSVLLYRDRDTSSAYHSWWGERPLLARTGGYWWDGTSWYRPEQIMDPAAERYARRRVPHATTQTAADLLDSSSTAEWGRLYKVAAFEPFEVPDDQWRNDLAYWAEQQTSRPDALGLEHCVVGLNAPELSQLLSVNDVARLTGVSAGTLREDFDHGFSEALPTPQAIVDGDPRWARPVVTDWQERRHRDHPEDILTGKDSGPTPAVAALWTTLDNNFADDVPRRNRHGSALQRMLSSWTGPGPSREVASDMAWIAALQSETLLPPVEPMIHVIEQAVLREFTTAPIPPSGITELNLNATTGRLLVWFVWHMPRSVPALFGSIIGAAERREVLSREMAINTLRSTVLLEADKRFDEQTLREFLDACLPPTWQE